MTDQAMGHVCPPSVIKWLNSPLRKLLQNPQKIMGEYVKPGDTVVDLGCGGGFFTIALADMVGVSGKVIAVDIQEEMLNLTRGFGSKKKVLDRITIHLCQESDIALPIQKVDFALAFYMVHEVPDRLRLFQQVAGLLKPEAQFMVVEPIFHVSASQFEQIIGEADSAGLRLAKPMKIFLSRGGIFKRK